MIPHPEFPILKLPTGAWSELTFEVIIHHSGKSKLTVTHHRSFTYQLALNGMKAGEKRTEKLYPVPHQPDIPCLSQFRFVIVTKKPPVSNYTFITLLHEWVDRRQMHQLEKLLCVIPILSLEVYYWSFSNRCICPLSTHLCSKVKNA